MTIRELYSVMNMNIKLDFVEHRTDKKLDLSNRLERLKNLDRVVYMIFPTDEPNHLQVVVH